ncbi:MAG: hypothetical protein AAB229_09875, partial [Candidatus Hydrogenedentota bacterium]
TAPPIVRLDSSSASFTLSIMDDFSGVDGSSLQVVDATDRTLRTIEGRYDPDRNWFLPDTPIQPGRRLRISSSDRAGNSNVCELTWAGMP